MTHEPETPAASPSEIPLQGWKEIAAYLGRDQRTTRRWELEEALPIYRHRTSGRSSVYAYPSELNRWREKREQHQPDATAPRSHRWTWGLAAGAAIAALLIAGPILHPPTPLADAAARSGAMVARQVWAGEGVDDSGDVSPDGTELAYVDWEQGSLKVRNLESGETKTLVEGDNYESGEPNAAAYRPDGRAIAYVRDDHTQNDYEIWLLDFDAGDAHDNAKEILEWKGRIISLNGWSSDGTRLLAVLESEDRIQRIALVSVADGKITTLKTVGWLTPSAFLSPDGRYVAYDLPEATNSISRNIFVLTADGRVETEVVSHPADDAVVGWSPDGKSLLFTSDRSGVTSLYSLAVENGRATGEPTVVKAGTGPIHAIGKPVNGRLHYSVVTQTRRIWLADLASLKDPGGSPKVLATRAPGDHNGPDFSPDGRYLAFLSSEPRRDSSSRLFIRELETGKEWSFGRETTGLTLMGNYGTVRFAPDSRRVLVKGWDDRNRQLNATIDVQTGETKTVSTPRLDFKGGMFALDWLDNRTALIRGGASWEEGGKERFANTAIALDVETRTERQIHQAEGGFIEAAVSPSGDQIAYVSSGLKTVSLGGGKATAIDLPAAAKPNFSTAWSADGQYLYFVANRESVWRIPAQGGEAEDLGIRIDRLQRLALHPDGRRIALGGGTRASEIWSLENVFSSPTD